MKNYKKVTASGAVGIPVDMRRYLGLQKGDPVEVEVLQDEIVIRLYQPRCLFCDTQNGVKKFKGRFICDKCAKEVGGKKRG